MNTGAVWIIDEDMDDKFLVQEIWKELELSNEVVWFTSGDQVIEYLKSHPTPPFIMLCDVNLSKMDGFELRESLIQGSKSDSTSVPFIFWSSYASEDQIRRAYDLAAHGFFIKAEVYEDVKSTFRDIIQYWQQSAIPSK